MALGVEAIALYLGVGIGEARTAFFMIQPAFKSDAHFVADQAPAAAVMVTLVRGS